MTILPVPPICVRVEQSVHGSDMEDQEDKPSDSKFPRKLDYNAPLLSTRRPTGATILAAPPPAAPVVPFSWEQAPGKPKDLETKDNTHDMGIPPPKLPPCRWHQTKESAMEDIIDQCLDDDQEDSCDGEIDGGDGGGDDGDDVFFSDAIDMFSLAETTDMLEALDNASTLASGVHSPSFIIQRFLIDANELAASSASNIDLSEHMNKKHPHYSSNCHNKFVSQAVRQSHSSPQGCGLDTFFFPWRMKHRPCGLKSPVRQPSLNAKPQCSARRKPKY